MGELVAGRIAGQVQAGTRPPGCGFATVYVETANKGNCKQMQLQANANETKAGSLRRAQAGWRWSIKVNMEGVPGYRAGAPPAAISKTKCKAGPYLNEDPVHARSHHRLWLWRCAECIVSCPGR